MRILATTALALVAVATPAFAQDSEFQGPRAEIVGGWDRVQGQGDGKSGFTYGGAIGFDLQRGTTVFGVEGEITGSTTKVRDAGAELKAGRDLYVGARAGVVVAPSTLVYAKAGYTNARVNLETATIDDGLNLDGYRIGAGVERNFGPAYGKIEYRYSAYNLNLERHQVLAGVGVRF